MAKRDSHCAWCGAAHTVETWPRTCGACGNMTYKNPLPVAVIVLPIDDGVLLIRRGIPPEGKLALPGGFLDHEETWQDAASRELREETRIRVEPDQFKLLTVLSGSGGAHLLVFCEAPAMSAADLPTFMPNVETLDRVFTREPRELAFPTHTQVLRDWFARRRGAGTST